MCLNLFKTLRETTPLNFVRLWENFILAFIQDSKEEIIVLHTWAPLKECI